MALAVAQTSACRPGGAGGATGAPGETHDASTDEPLAARGADGAVAGAAEAAGATEAPLGAEGGTPRVEELPLESGFPLLVWAPEGRGPFPLLVAAHGAGCVAEDHCAYWWRLTEGRAIVACLRGEPLYRTRPEQGFFFRDHFALGRELELSVRTLTQHFGARLGERATFAGYSQGATMGALALPQSGLAFAELVFIEGGGEGMTQRSIDSLRAAGTERVLFVCGTSGCSKRARSTAGTLARSGIDARAVDAPGAGHTYLGAVEVVVGEQTAWLWP